MTRFVSTIAIVVLGLVALGAVGPKIAAILSAAVPVIFALTVCVLVLRVVFWYTRRW